MKRQFLLMSLFCLFSLQLISSCTHNNTSSTSSTQEIDRNVASEYSNAMYTKNSGSSATIKPEWQSVLSNEALLKGGQVHFPEGLNPTEAADLWHLSEGSDTFPLAWFMKMNSLMSKSPYKEKTKLHQNLSEKYGVIKEGENFAKSHRYPMKYVGLSTSWSGALPQSADVTLNPGQDIETILGVRALSNGSKSIAMLGTNCAFCHTSQVRVNGQSKILEGAPSMLYMRGFFQDMLGSTAKTMLTETLLAQFLGQFPHIKNPQVEAKNFSEQMKHELGLDSTMGAVIESIGNTAANYKAILNVGDKIAKGVATKVADVKQAKVKQVFFEKQTVVAKYLTRLLALTYNLKDQEISRELHLRMQWLSKSMGQDPKLAVTPEGYSRTDAFGRISNWVARGDHPIDLTATVSVPPMWNIKYKATFHWNGNTNSVLMRNIGQSFGLGAIITGSTQPGKETYQSTSNLYNLNRLEKLLYKIQVPTWKEVTMSEVDIDKVIPGCNLYYAKCAHCHTPAKTRVGPSKELIRQHVIFMKEVGTDPVYAQNQGTPVGNVPFRKALFGFTGNIRDQYYKTYNISEEQKREWQHTDLRGDEIFRDTYLGENTVQGVSSYMNVKMKTDASGKVVDRPGYLAPLLAGAWATGPYLHNGSVPTIYDVLSSPSKRPKIFFVGRNDLDTKKLGYLHSPSDFVNQLSTEERTLVLSKATQVANRLNKPFQLKKNAPNYSGDDVLAIAACEVMPEKCFNSANKGNSNQGHPFGEVLNEEQKYQVIEFLKVLRPEAEYSRNANPIYQWNGTSCSAVQ